MQSITLSVCLGTRNGTVLRRGSPGNVAQLNIPALSPVWATPPEASSQNMHLRPRHSVCRLSHEDILVDKPQLQTKQQRAHDR